MALYETHLIAVVLPVFNDWEAAAALLPLIDQALNPISCSARILLIDDASSMAPDHGWEEVKQGRLRNIEEVSILHLRRNLGHQRAIAIGLAYIHRNWRGFDALVVMDGDGEDRPQDIPALLEAFAAEGGEKVVFAARSKRLESALFQFFYHAYRVLHKALTGVAVRVGNFSVLPPKALETLMVVSELWNHYAAAIFRARIPHRSIPLPRGARLAGKSKMNSISLLMHGISAISVFSDVVGARLLPLGAGATVAVAVLAAIVFGAHLFLGYAIPAWAAYAAAILLSFLMQALIVCLALVFIIASGRAGSSFLPIRDADFFFDRVEMIVRAKAAAHD
jgi:hypothetical protein